MLNPQTIGSLETVKFVKILKRYIRNKFRPVMQRTR